MLNYEKKLGTLHDLADNLMSMIAPGAPEINIPLLGSKGTESRPTAAPAEEIQKYKALLDSGAITEEEYATKKRQLLNI